MRRASRRPGLLSRAYAWLSRLYPASFRDDYQRELDAAFRHQIDEAGSRRTQVAVGALADVLRTAPAFTSICCARTSGTPAHADRAVAALLRGRRRPYACARHRRRDRHLQHRLRGDARAAAVSRRREGGADLRDQSVAQHQVVFGLGAESGLVATADHQDVAGGDHRRARQPQRRGRGDPRQWTQGNGKLLRGERPAARQGPRIHGGRGPARRTEGRHCQRGTLAAPLRRTQRHPWRAHSRRRRGVFRGRHRAAGRRLHARRRPVGADGRRPAPPRGAATSGSPSSAGSPPVRPWRTRRRNCKRLPARSRASSRPTTADGMPASSRCSTGSWARICRSACGCW